MTDEEKKAIKELTEIKELVEEDLKYKDYESTAILDQIDLESLVIILNLIEKQQKEIEDLKEVNKEHQKINGELRDEIKRQGNTREIEEKYVEEKFISKDKIKVEIEELKNMKVNGEIFTTAVNFAIKILQELLEEK